MKTKRTLTAILALCACLFQTGCFVTLAYEKDGQRIEVTGKQPVKGNPAK